MSDQTNDKLSKREKEAKVKKAEAEAAEAEAKAAKGAADARKAATEAEAAAFKAVQDKEKAQLPSGESKPVEGKIETDDKFGYLAEVSAYQAMNLATEAIAQTLADKTGTRSGILIVDALDCCIDDIAVQQVMEQLLFFETELIDQEKKNQGLRKQRSGIPEDAMPMAASATLASTLALVSGSLSAVADIVGFFKTDIAISGREVDLSGNALRAGVAGHLAQKGRQVYLRPFHRLKSSLVIQRLGRCIKQRQALRESTALLKAQEGDNPDAPNKGGKSEVEMALARSQVLIEEFDAFNKRLTAVPEGQSRSLLARIALQQWIDSREAGITHLLFLEVASSGGESITTKSLFRSQKADFLGGGTFTYLLVEMHGRIVAASNKVKLANATLKLGEDKVPIFRWDKADLPPAGTQQAASQTATKIKQPSSLPAPSESVLPSLEAATTHEVTMTVSSNVRRAGASVEAQSITLDKQSDGSFKGSKEIELEDNEILVYTTVKGVPGVKVKSSITINSVKKEEEDTLTAEIETFKHTYTRSDFNL